MFKTKKDFVSQPDRTIGNVEYKIAPNDILSVSVYTNEGIKLIDLTANSNSLNDATNVNTAMNGSNQYTVDIDGFVKLPIIGKIKIQNLTTREADKLLEQQYATYYNKPFVITKVLNRRVLVFPGEGGAGRVVTLTNENTTLIEGLALAGRNVEWFLMFMTLSIIVWYVIVRYTPPMYESAALMKLNTDNNVTKALNITRDVYQEQNNEVAGNLELIRSSIIVGKAIATLPMRVTYISKGTLLENEMYKSCPFEVNFLVKDSLWMDRPFYLQFNNEKTFVLSYTPVGQRDQVDEEYEINKWIHLNGISLQINIIDFQRILKYQSQLKRTLLSLLLIPIRHLLRISVLSFQSSWLIQMPRQ
ncbi:MAG: polysaccharide biosynthesis/export family protein [Bacteroidota bacterium]|nr:MAG: polysaccharide biosynthesis/export family protein [Bacteroidota bacterium]